MIATWRSDPVNCPRRVDPVVADIMARNPFIRCTYVARNVLFACEGGLRLQGLFLQLSAPRLPQTADALAVNIYNEQGKYLRKLIQLFELASSAVAALGPNRTYLLKSAALSAASQVTVNYGVWQDWAGCRVAPAAGGCNEGSPGRGKRPGDLPCCNPTDARRCMPPPAACPHCSMPAYLNSPAPPGDPTLLCHRCYRAAQ